MSLPSKVEIHKGKAVGKLLSCEMEIVQVSDGIPIG